MRGRRERPVLNDARAKRRTQGQGRGPLRLPAANEVLQLLKSPLRNLRIQRQAKPLRPFRFAASRIGSRF